MSRTMDIPDFDSIDHMNEEQFRTFATLCCLNFQQHQKEQNGDIRRIKKHMQILQYGIILIITMLLPETIPEMVKVVLKMLGG